MDWLVRMTFDQAARVSHMFLFTLTVLASLLLIGTLDSYAASPDDEKKLTEARAQRDKKTAELNELLSAITKKEAELKATRNELNNLRIKKSHQKNAQERQELQRREDVAIRKVSQLERDHGDLSRKKAQLSVEIDRSRDTVIALEKARKKASVTNLQGANNQPQQPATQVIGGNSTTLSRPAATTSSAQSSNQATTASSSVIGANSSTIISGSGGVVHSGGASSSAQQSQSSSGDQAYGGNATVITTNPTSSAQAPSRDQEQKVGAMANAGVLHPSLVDGAKRSNPRALSRLASVPSGPGNSSELNVGATASVGGPIVVPGTPGNGRPARPNEPLEAVAVDVISRPTQAPTPRLPLAPQATESRPRVSAREGVSLSAASRQLTSEVRLTRLFFRDGFPEVGLIVHAEAPVCSGVLVHYNWVLTAAHCVAQIDSSGSVQSAFEDIGQLGVYLPRSGGSPAYLIDSHGGRAIQKSALRHLPVENYVVHSLWKGAEEYDVALIRVPQTEWITDSDLPVLVSTRLTARTEITMAGYGNTASAMGVTGGMLEVGWQVSRFDAGQLSTFQWYYGEGKEAESTSSTCLMDSGGPVFLGVQQGYVGETHVLAGIISGFRQPAPGLWQWTRARPCRGGEALNVRLDMDEIRSWICTVTRYTVRGCVK